ncbi:MAG: hypothetical protein ACXWUG_01060 [Polyangiales bacterium]
MRKPVFGSIPCFLLLSSCGGAPASMPEPKPRSVIAATDEGFAVVDAWSGRVLSTYRSKASVDHLVFDPYRRALLTFESDDRDEGGTIVSRSLDALEVESPIAFVDGVARLHPAPFGVVVFEESYGTRWRLLGSPRGIPAPMPSAVWSSPSGAVHALTHDDDGWSSRSATFVHDGLSIEASAVDPDSPFARGIALGFDSIADARALDDELVVLLVANPPRVVVASRVASIATLALDDDVRLDLARGLVVVDPAYVLVGTAKAVRSVRVLRSPDIAIESSFVAPSVHAPIDGPL